MKTSEARKKRRLLKNNVEPYYRKIYIHSTGTYDVGTIVSDIEYKLNAINSNKEAWDTPTLKIMVAVLEEMLITYYEAIEINEANK